ncbi:iron compound permease protein of ABC transporter family [Klebsiella pneumoniae]|uniref:Iron compound permease protein of ABC transporter family n=1 Tax=Klebsiella pneumoniae TaxID=573 RepID=A0A377TU68_KLEPN|nr:iron compound permease protein of ABC transporter family [Klebsiella pneumoniae]
MSVAILLSARRRPRPRLALLLLTLLLIAASLVHLGLGARWIAPQTVLRALLEYDPRNFEQRIIIDLRLVRLAAALLTGAALGVAGLLLQTVIRNRLASRIFSASTPAPRWRWWRPRRWACLSALSPPGAR